MALTLTSGTATGAQDLLEQIHDFFDGSGLSGWTVEDYVTSGLASPFGSDHQLSLRMGSECYFHFATDVTASRKRLNFAPSRGITTGGSVLWRNMPDSPHANSLSGTIETQFSCMISIPVSATTFNWWLIGDARYFYIVAEMDGGWFQVGFCGKLTPFGSLADDAFFCEGSGDGTERGGFSSDYDFDDVSRAPNIKVTSPCCPESSHPQSSGSVVSTGALWSSYHGKWIGKKWSDVGASNVALSQYSFGSSTPTPAAGAMFHGAWTTFQQNLVQPLVPCVLYAPLVSVSGKYGARGVVPGAYYVETKQIGEAYAGVTPLVIGSNRYFIFPAARTRRVPDRLRYSGIAIEIPAA